VPSRSVDLTASMPFRLAADLAFASGTTPVPAASARKSTGAGKNGNGRARIWPDGAFPGLAAEDYDLIVADPPYSHEDAAHYGTPPVNRNKVVDVLSHRMPPATYQAQQGGFAYALFEGNKFKTALFQMVQVPVTFQCSAEESHHMDCWTERVEARRLLSINASSRLAGLGIPFLFSEREGSITFVPKLRRLAGP